MAGNATYNPIFASIIPIPYPNTSSSESIFTEFSKESEVTSGVIVIFTTSLNTGFCLSQSAIVGEKE